jgi:hypothetical protein
MKDVRSLGFDTLEARKLLTKLHHGDVNHPAAEVTTPIALDGILNLDENAATGSGNSSGGTTMSTPVAGELAGLGKFHGTWKTSEDSTGGYIGPDTLRITNGKGSLLIEFNQITPAPAYPTPTGGYYYQDPERLAKGTGVFAGNSEHGTIKLYTTASRAVVVALGLSSPIT